MSSLTSVEVYKKELDEAVLDAHAAVDAVGEKLNAYLKRLDEEPGVSETPAPAPPVVPAEPVTPPADVPPVPDPVATPPAPSTSTPTPPAK